MDREDWTKVAALVTIASGVIRLHGLTTRGWKIANAVVGGIGIVAAVCYWRAAPRIEAE
jgi:hypothetical protein